jgi:two-component system CheB/CheR fusion protein
VHKTVDDHQSVFSENGVQLTESLPADPLWAFADASRIAQVVANLLGNAAKFTPRGGRVELSLEREGALALLRVRDNGVGIEPEVIGHLFTPFTQAEQSLDRNRGGLGLGLALVRMLTELHGGTVAVASKGLEQGAEFTVRLPLVQSPTGVAHEPAQNRPRTRRVLVIEDNTDVADTLKTALEIMGHTVCIADDGPTGIAEARTFRPEIVLCDIGLPGMSGYEVAQAFRADETLRGTALVALSGYARPEDRERSAASGFACHIAKPVGLDVLERMLETVI